VELDTGEIEFTLYKNVIINKYILACERIGNNWENWRPNRLGFQRL